MSGSNRVPRPVRGSRAGYCCGEHRGPQLLVLGMMLAGIWAGCQNTPAISSSPWALSPNAADWRAPDGRPAPRLSGTDLLFTAPFPSGRDRHVWDMNVPSTFAAEGVHGFEWVYTLEPADAFRALTWHVRSGAGWYAATLPATSGRQQVWRPFSDFETEGAVAGWDRVSVFRLSPWSGGEGRGTLRLHAVRTRRARLAILRPGPESVPREDERAFAEQTAQRWLDDLYRIGQPAVTLDAPGLRASDLTPFDAVVLPYNPEPSSALLRALLQYVDTGGRLWVSYNPNEELAAALGVRLQSWLQATPPGRFHQWQFTEDDWSGPPSVVQSAPHLLPVRPARDDAVVLAHWADATGRRQAEPAVIISPRGAWFSYLLGRDNETARLQALAFILDRHQPSAALTAVRHKAEQLAAATSSAQAMPEAAQQAQAAMESAMARSDAAAAWSHLSQWSAAQEGAGVTPIRWPTDMALGIWDHTGRGLYPGDWNRTMALLADTGFTDVFVYVRYGGSRPTRAVQAASAHDLNVHAWPIVFNIEAADPQSLAEYRRAGRLQTRADGSPTTWLCPALPENRDDELARVLQLAGTPGVHGLHLDYVRYPDAAYCFGPACRRLFEKHYGRSLPSWPEIPPAAQSAFETWRAGAISTFVESVAAAVREHYPQVRLSAAVWPDVATVKPQLGQDWPHWLEREWLDFVVPMNYTEREAELRQWMQRQLALPGAAGRVWMGLGVTASHTRLSPRAALRQARLAVEQEATGVVIFDLNATTAEGLFPLLRSIQRDTK